MFINTYTLLLGLWSLAFWSALYSKCTKMWHDKDPEWASRVITMLHGCVATLIGSWLCGVPSIARCNMRIGFFHYLLMVWSWGYFCFDLLWCIYYWPYHYLMLCHHATALAGISMYLGKTNSGCIFPCSLALMEITNPLLQTRWFLRQSGFEKTIIFTIVEVTYLLMFVGFRGILGTYLVIKIIDTDSFKKDEKIITLILYFVSIGFIYEVLGFVLYKYKTKIKVQDRFLDKGTPVFSKKCQTQLNKNKLRN